ncbi:OLC1v1004628C1 [Oldenlandia corymbosa var. corymbosa]|uniref:OLC1v1004628C1 n=1 Tax=Oldenlandia corymbosa var. corymbosa TaxID=529605 RepID=A0AAV1DCY3_OLDCO|nr:OLC1v1004628C1 [Oldenlandia corymbosa var. corymbosa]
MCEWMVEFKTYLTLKYLAFVTVNEADEEMEVLVDELRATVCVNISVHMEKGEESFIKDYLSGFVEVVCDFLRVASSSSSREKLIVAAIKFLTRVSMSVRHVIVPELQSMDLNGFPFLKAGALKFFTVFKIEIEKPVALMLLPDMVAFLNSESNVVHSYAVTCIEKILLVKDDGRPRFTSTDIAYFLDSLMANLFTALQKSESGENHYLMKCVMRVLGVAEMRSLRYPVDEFIHNLVIFMCRFLIKYGADKLVVSINAVKNDLFHKLLEMFWVPNLEDAASYMERKITSVSSSKLLCELPDIWESGLAGKLLNSIVTLVSRFPRLYNVQRKEEDPLKEIKDPKQYFVVSLGKLCAASPRLYTSIITDNLD